MFMLLKFKKSENSPRRCNIYAPNIRAPKYMKQTLTESKEEMDSSMVRVGNSPLSVIDRTTRQRISRKTELEQHHSNWT